MLGIFTKKFNVKYITGIPVIKKPTDNYNLEIESGGLKLNRIFNPEIHIKWESISKISSETEGQVTKGLSAGKAAVGLVLLGPLGALIGAGMGTKHDNRVTFLSIIYKDDDGEENTLVLQTKKAYEIANTLILERKTYYKTNNIPLAADNQAINSVNNLDELEKLSELKDKGIITQEEFDQKKKQILGL